MLTVKHRCPEGHETIVAADSVAFNPGKDTGRSVLYLFGASPSPATIGAETALRDGVAYVMNDAGATVGTYRMPEA
ncbi:hypothetical protein [Tardiphaga sp.]|uniref:hypothetical protein n=1 Tax=Tardiphaga sp. TaxID=1926292 RepID=UPI002631A67B|nr:hypothetical protein [Tardiphaga sp.]MDB5618222.1 hypothetical protein [Tardiphaga sp.]